MFPRGASAKHMKPAVHQFYMSRAIQLAYKGLYTTQPNPRVGCVIVKDDRIVGEGYHQQAGGPHAEIYALQQAAQQAHGATAYVTLEPCSHHGKTPPCADALIEAGVSRVVCGMQDPNPLVSGQGLERLREAGIEVESAVMQAEAEAINPGFIKRMRDGLPFVRVKLAMSLDGRTAMASGESKWISGDSARHDVQKLRARSCVVLSGSGTVLADNPSMNVRLTAGELNLTVQPHQPLRAVIDSQLKVPADSQIYTLPGDSVVFSAIQPAADYACLNVQTMPLNASSNQLDLRHILGWLAEQQANEVHVEAGSVLCGALLSQQLVDEIVIYMAPHLMGDSASGLFHLPEITQMSQRIDCQINDMRAVGKDWRITLVPRYQH